MGLFGNFSTQEKKKPPTLFMLAQERYKENKELLKEIELYLESRKEQRNLPSRTSWIMQLDILDEIAEEKRAETVRNSTLKGYRQIAYKNKKEIKESIKKEIEEEKDIIIINEEF